MSERLLSANGITLWRGDTLLLNDVDVEINAAEVLQLQGANGSGKTTLLRIICGLTEAEEGQITWCGRPLQESLDDFHSRLLYLGHRPGIKSALTPVENLTLFQQLGAATNISITDALDALSLLDKQNIACSKLSAGQQRRVALARLLLQRADLWVLDEPLTALDAHGLDWLSEQIKAQALRGGATILTTHQALQIDGVSIRTQVLAGT